MIRDMFNGAPLERDPLVAGNRTGVGIDTGPAPLSIAEFAYDVTFEDVHLEDCRQPELDHLASWYLHDIFGLNISNCSISNKGASPWTPGDYMAGMLASDVMGSIESLTLRGLANSFHTINTMVFLKVTHLDIMGSPGVAPVGAVGLKLEHGAAGGLSIERLSAENLHTLFITGPEFVPDWSFTVEDFRSEGFEATNLVLGFSLEAQPLYSGDVVELVATTSTERHLVSSTGPSTRNAIVATGAPGSPGQGYMLVVPAPVSRCQVRCTTAAVQIGDLIVASGIPRRAEANNDPPSPFVVLGKALTAKPDGVEGLVLLGPA